MMRAAPCLVVALLLALCWSGIPARAQTQGQAKGPIQVAAPMTRAAVDAVLDGAILSGLSRDHIVGAAAVVAQGDQIVTARGYGLADRARRVPVDPARTLFRMGSMSKIVTAAAVMQLVEAGRLDLDRDVNDYLDFHIPATTGRPITLRLLLSHRAGFPERLKLLFLTNPGKTPALGEYLRHYLPPRTYPFSDVPSYSNYGSALAGYVVQRVSHAPFADYVATHIFTPLGMIATIQQPPAGGFGTAMARGYLAGGKLAPFEMIAASPAGAVSATPVSFVRFLQALANGGALGSARILQPQSVTAMLRFADPESPEASVLRRAMGIGFMLDQRAPVTTASHDGATNSFAGTFRIYEQPRVVLFYVQNTQPTSDLIGIVETGFERRFMPGTKVGPRAVLTADPALNRAITGWYRSTRWPAQSVLAISGLFEAHRLDARPDGSLDWMNATYARVGAGLFESRTDPARALLPLREANGRVVALAFSPSARWERLVFWDTPPFNIIVVAVATLAALALLVTAGVHVVGIAPGTRVSQRTWAVAATGVIVLAAGIGCFISVLRSFQADPTLMEPAADPSIRVAQLLIVVGLVLGAIATGRLIAHRSIPAAAAGTVSFGGWGWMVFHWQVVSVSLLY